MLGVLVCTVCAYIFDPLLYVMHTCVHQQQGLKLTLKKSFHGPSSRPKVTIPTSAGPLVNAPEAVTKVPVLYC